MLPVRCGRKCGRNGCKIVVEGNALPGGELRSTPGAARIAGKGMPERAQQGEMELSVDVEGSVPAFEARLFGPWEARVHGEPLPPLRSRRAEWLLAFLLLQGGRPAQRAWLAGLFWPE